MRRWVILLVVSLLLAACGSTSGPRVWATPAQNHRLTACASTDCGSYAVTLHFDVTIAGLTGYNLFVNGQQVDTGATSPYVFYGLDCGSTYSLGVQAHDGSGHVNGPYYAPYTTPSCVAGNAPVNTGEPVVSGTVATGQTLSTTNGSWSFSPTSFGYQWQDCGTDGTSCSNIVGATNSTYTVQAGDAGHSVEALVTATNATGSSAPAGAPIVPLIDEFSGSTIDPNLWHVMNQQGDTSGNEQQCYMPSQAAESGGFMTETAAFVSGGFTCPAGTPSDPSCTGACATVASGGTAHYKSAAVQEIGTAFTFGTITARIKLGGVAGNDSSPWGAIWLLGAACQGPTSWLTGTAPSTGAFFCPWADDTQDAAEIDIAEDNTQGSTSVRENLFNSAATNHGCISGTVSDVHSNFHTYELDWTSGSMVFKIDGATQSACTVTGASVPSHPMFLILQTALQPVPVSGDFPFATSVDWVHVSH